MQICEKRGWNYSPPPGPDPPSIQCEEGWEEFSDRCYLVGEAAASWYEAEQVGHTAVLSLVAIPTAGLQQHQSDLTADFCVKQRGAGLHPRPPRYQKQFRTFCGRNGRGLGGNLGLARPQALDLCQLPKWRAERR